MPWHIYYLIHRRPTFHIRKIYGSRVFLNQYKQEEGLLLHYQLMGEISNYQKSDLLLQLKDDSSLKKPFFVRTQVNFESNFPSSPPILSSKKEETKDAKDSISKSLLLFESKLIDQKQEISLKPGPSPDQANHKIFHGRNPF